MIFEACLARLTNNGPVRKNAMNPEMSYYSYKDFCIIIPTYNGASHQLREVLVALQNQQHIAHLAWEIIVADNNSKDQTIALVQELQASWNRPFPLRYIHEPKQGQAYARCHGVRVSSGEIMGFLDDDNVPDLDWVKEAYDFGKQHPKAGVWNGKCIAKYYEQEPEPGFEPIAPFLAICDHGDVPQQYHWALPAGAGLVVRRKAWLQSFREIVLPGRTPGAWLGNEDLQISMFLQRDDWEIWYNPKMRIHHYIPKARLEPQKLKLLLEGSGLSGYITRYLRFSAWLWPLVFILFFAKDTIWLLRHLIRHCHDLKTNSIAQYQLQLYWGFWRSPWFFLVRKIRSWSHKT